MRTSVLGLVGLLFITIGCEQAANDLSPSTTVAGVPTALPIVSAARVMRPSVSLVELSRATVQPPADLRLPTNLSGRVVALSEDAGEAGDGSGQPRSCVAWVTVEESYDAATGEFRYQYDCPEGGDIASIVTVGNDDGQGAGHYTTTYQMRDGSTQVWEADYATGADGTSQHVDSASNDGQTLVGDYQYGPGGITIAHEVWTGAEGTSVTDYTTTPGGAYSGSSVFDDPSTEASPDWTTEFSYEADGTYTYTSTGTWEQWAVVTEVVGQPDGSEAYVYSYDDPATAVLPDYEGQAALAADGTGEGTWTGLADDGSVSTGHDVYAADGSVFETWTWDDPATAQAPDQEGETTYHVDGTATGTVTEHAADGSSVTCPFSMTADEAVTWGECE